MSNSMAATANNVTNALPREMQAHTYAIMREVEGQHWWYVGRRRIIASWVERVCREIGKRRTRILDVGCGTGANLQMLAEFGVAEGVDVSDEALDFCRARGLVAVRQGAAESLPYEDAQFDLVTDLDGVARLDTGSSPLTEMFLVMRTVGRAVLF